MQRRQSRCSTTSRCCNTISWTTPPYAAETLVYAKWGQNVAILSGDYADGMSPAGASAKLLPWCFDVHTKAMLKCANIAIHTYGLNKAQGFGWSSST